MVNKEEIKQAVTENIRKVYDPEIPVNVFELGLIYDISVDDEANVDVLMTLTAPNCPVAESLPNEVRQRAREAEGVREADVRVTFDPPWEKSMMSDAAKLELGLL